MVRTYGQDADLSGIRRDGLLFFSVQKYFSDALISHRTASIRSAHIGGCANTQMRAERIGSQ